MIDVDSGNGNVMKNRTSDSVDQVHVADLVRSPNSQNGGKMGVEVYTQATAFS